MHKKIFLAATVLIIMITQLLFTIRPSDADHAEIMLPENKIIYNRLYSTPKSVNAVMITPEKDFSAIGTSQTDALKIIRKITSGGGDTVIINTSYDSKNLIDSAPEVLLSICSAAKLEKVTLYINLDISLLIPSGYEFAEQVDAVCSRASDIVHKYSADGFIISMPKSESHSEKLTISHNSSIGEWGSEYSLSLIRYLCSALKNCSNALIIGVEHEENLDISELVLEGIADFIFINNEFPHKYSDIPSVIARKNIAENVNQSNNPFPLAYESNFNIAINNQDFTHKQNINIFAAKTLSPSGLAAAKHGESINISIEALSGSSLYASFAGREVVMTQGEKSPSSDGYSIFYGEMPIGDDNISSRLYINGKYNNFCMRITGALITVTKSGNLLLGVDDEEVVHVSSFASQQIKLSQPNSQYGKIVRITEENTLSYNPYCSEKLIPSPDYPRLAKGMLDYYVRTSYVTEQKVKMYVLASGRMIKASCAELLAEGKIESNQISAKKIYMDGLDTIIEFSQTYKTPYTISYNGFEYQKNIYGNWGDYFVDEFSPSQLVICFDYCDSVSGALNFPENSLFDGFEWSEVNVKNSKKLCLKLDIRKGERFAGVSVSYTPEGNLKFRFNYLEHSLDGMVIIVDQGHGYLSADSYDPGAIGVFGDTKIYEADINLKISLLVTEKLLARGANVIRFDTEKTPYDTFKRSDIARNYSPDLFISIHSDAHENKSAFGNSSYYFTPFSADLAKSVSSRIAGFFSATLYDGKDCCKGNFYDYFAVTTQQDFPSILIETGFITNYNEATALNVPENQNAIAECIVLGIEDYLRQG